MVGDFGDLLQTLLLASFGVAGAAVHTLKIFVGSGRGRAALAPAQHELLNLLGLLLRREGSFLLHLHDGLPQLPLPLLLRRSLLPLVSIP